MSSASLASARRPGWRGTPGGGKPAVLAVGAVNAIGAVIALINHSEGALIGLGVSAAIIVLGALSTDTDMEARPYGPLGVR